MGSLYLELQEQLRYETLKLIFWSESLNIGLRKKNPHFEKYFPSVLHLKQIKAILKKIMVTKVLRYRLSII